MELLEETIRKLQQLPTSATATANTTSNTLSVNTKGVLKVSIPSYDKSLHEGLGDRKSIEQWEVIEGKLFIVVYIAIVL